MANSKSSPAMTIIGIVVGAALMVGGMVLQPTLAPITKPLEAQGLLLDLGKTVATIGVFLILFPVLNLFFFQPLKDAIQERTSNLEQTFGEAEALRADMAKMKSDYERQLAEAHDEARTQIQAQVKEAQDMRNQMMRDAAFQRDEMVAKAQQEIETEKNRVMNEIRVKVVDLSLTAAEKILGENVDDARNRRLVEEFIDKMEAPV